MKIPMLILAAVLLVGCERKPTEPPPVPSAAPPAAPTVTTNPDATVINRPVENPPLTNRPVTNTPAPPP